MQLVLFVYYSGDLFTLVEKGEKVIIIIPYIIIIIPLKFTVAELDLHVITCSHILQHADRWFKVRAHVIMCGRML